MGVTLGVTSGVTVGVTLGVTLGVTSKTAWYSVCNGIEMASSSAVTFGYLSREIFWSIFTGLVSAPEPPASERRVSNMNAFHRIHHFFSVEREPAAVHSSSASAPNLDPIAFKSD